LFGRIANEGVVKKYVLKNKNGFEVVLLSFGATVQSINVKDRNGRSVNVVLGLNTIEGLFY
jgi:aldose 1-epimerase